MTSPTPAESSATPVISRARQLHWSVAAPLSAAAGVGSAVIGFLADMPVLGLAGAVVAAVPAVLAARHVPALQADLARCEAEQRRAARARAEQVAAAEAAAAEARAELAAALAASESAPVRPFVAATTEQPTERATEQATEQPTTVDLVAAEQAPPVVDLVKAPRPRPAQVDLVKTPEPVVPAPVQHLVRHAAVAAGRVSPAASPATAAASAAGADGEADAIDPRVDTAELQRIWDLGEAANTRTGRGRRARVGAEIDALPDRPRNLAGHRRRARHRA